MALHIHGHDSGAAIGSFKQQLDHLLTEKERSQLRKALQIYAEKRFDTLSTTTKCLPLRSRFNILK